VLLQNIHYLICFIPNCKTDKYGLLYNGSIHTTINGYTCQDWDSDVPHVHYQHSLASSENYCRNPHHGPLGPWCYTNKLLLIISLKVCGMSVLVIFNICRGDHVILWQQSVVLLKTLKAVCIRQLSHVRRIVFAIYNTYRNHIHKLDNSPT
jgi:hypothetical protein